MPITRGWQCLSFDFLQTPLKLLFFPEQKKNMYYSMVQVNRLSSCCGVPCNQHPNIQFHEFHELKNTKVMKPEKIGQSYFFRFHLFPKITPK